MPEECSCHGLRVVATIFVLYFFLFSKTFNPFKDFKSDQVQRSAFKIFTAHYAYRNADLNLTPVMGTTNGFIFSSNHYISRIFLR